MTPTPDCVDYLPGWVDDADRLFDQLRDEISWEQHAITLFGRTVPTPRLTAWMGDAAYRYSGIVNEPKPWPAALATLRDRLRDELGEPFNSCLANLYRDGTDSMGYHSDDEPELGPEPTIASVSLGAGRRFVLRHRVTRERWTWELGAGDLLVMRRESQRDYAHAIPKTNRPIGPRMNLTFRQFSESHPRSAGSD
ncbi:MAG TPA: alpha-ketoglutarate-dependent dioxygenase AlkB [Propionibacteriaceae bacterium]|nr:alpha-ketoglutarate-dependent dioxygenase AlkB [Propionibacteriaceae bacterium]